MYADDAPDGTVVYQTNCASCHGTDRLGLVGPALLPENLTRLRKENAAQVIANGSVATQMPAFSQTLDQAEIDALVALIYTPLPEIPKWWAEEIDASRIINPDVPDTDQPMFDADPLNLFVVVETGDHHVTILNGDTFETIHRFKSRFALHGGPKFTPDGRYVFFASRDGWITKFDLYTLTVTAEARAGINTRNLAMSADGKYVAVANYLPHTLVILNASDLSIERIFDVANKDGTSSRVSAVYQAPTRNSFVAALKDVPEIWEISTDPDAPPVFEGMVHSHEKGMVEGLASSQGLFALRRIAVEEPLDDFFFDKDYKNLFGSTRGGTSSVVVNLNVGRPIAQLALEGFPHLGSGISWTWQGRQVMATPHLRDARVSIIDMENWSIVKTIETHGPGFFMRSHENTPYAWVDVFFGPNKDEMHIIDKRTLEIVKTLKPEPGKTVAHVEFTRDGAYALVSIWEMDGAVIVYDARTFEEVRRLPMVKPSGKYNVFN
ncbi:MAG: nitrite reductase, partial [Fimbriimonadaceae bacterium]|nr:nitrite reductase [Alphaproteobacteria bacterium]